MTCSCDLSRAARILADSLAADGNCPPGKCSGMHLDDDGTCQATESDLAACWLAWAKKEGKR